MTLFRILLLVIALWLSATGLKQFIQFKKLRFFLLFLISLVIVLFTLFPPLAQTISMKMGLGENLNTLIFTGFIIVFMYIVKLNKTVEHLRQEITRLVSSQALEQVERPNSVQTPHPKE